MNEDFLKKYDIEFIKIIDDSNYNIKFFNNRFIYTMPISNLDSNNNVGNYILHQFKINSRNKKLLKIKELTKNK